LNRKYVILAAVLLIVLISLSLFLTVNLLRKQASTRPFYVGVDFAYGNQFSQLKALVDKVKNYTNLFVIGSLDLTFNRTALDESCQYIFDSGLNFIVFITGYPMYNASDGWPGNTFFEWMYNATQRYGDQLLGFYRFDEPGGNQLDDGPSMLIRNNALSYAEIAKEYVGNLSTFVNYYATFGNTTDLGRAKIFTSDYGLYWFDYEASYSTIFAEFVGNQSRQRIIALERGAAQSFNEDWGVIVNWKYDQPPYLENSTELYSDLSLAYSAGATYAIVFSYPNITTSTYGTLTQPDFEALQKFWTAIHTNPGSFPSSPAEVAYVVPADFGFGFRNANDIIWGLFPADNYTSTQKIWNDTQFLLATYGDKLNIIYDDPSIIEPTLNNYTKVFYWNQTVT
jgi:hypothetical protein